jgi:hypothetical protein
MKLRGKKRYYKNLVNEEPPIWLNFEDPTKNWFDLYHQHIFNKYFKNHSWKSRKQHLDALFNLANKYEKLIIKFQKDYQYWIYINDSDSDTDAIYIHTENPNNSVFPLKVNNNPDLRSENANLEEYLQNKDYKIVRTIALDENGKQMINYFLQKPGNGIDIELKNGL